MATDEFFKQLKQGDLLRIASDDGEQIFAIVSQTCDVVLPKRETVLLAPVTADLTDVEERGAVTRSNPRYLLIEDHFIDLAKIRYANKEDITDSVRVAGLPDENSGIQRELAQAIGRWFSRFAFPDEVHPWLSPLQELIRSKYGKENSPLHKVLQDVVEVRVEADHWFKPGRTLTVHVIVKTSALAADFDSNTEVGLAVSEAVRATRTPNQVAEQMELIGSPYSSDLWMELAWSFADACKLSIKHASQPEFVEAVESVGADLWTEDDFTLRRMRQSEQLDIDFLSDPQPD